MILNLGEVTDNMKKNQVIHQFGHVLGMPHEHERSDFWSIVERHVDKRRMEKRYREQLKGSRDHQDKEFSYEKQWKKIKHQKHPLCYDPHSVMHAWYAVCISHYQCYDPTLPTQV